MWVLGACAGAGLLYRLALEVSEVTICWAC
jgi:hypothetical protein